MIRWGSQIDTRPIKADRDAGDGHGAGVAGYLAKYATKDAQSGGGLDSRIRVEGVIERAELVRSCPRADAIGLDPEPTLGPQPGLSGALG